MRFFNWSNLEFEPTLPQQTFSNHVALDMTQDAVQEEPRDSLVGKSLDDDRDGAVIGTVLESAVGNETKWML